MRDALGGLVLGCRGFGHTFLVCALQPDQVAICVGCLGFDPSVFAGLKLRVRVLLTVGRGY